MRAFENPYEVLGVSEAASYEAIKARYNRLAKRYHPDNGDEPDSVRMAAVNAAWDSLKTQEARARTDALLATLKMAEGHAGHGASQTEPEDSGAPGWGEPAGDRTESPPRTDPSAGDSPPDRAGHGSGERPPPGEERQRQDPQREHSHDGTFDGPPDREREVEAYAFDFFDPIMEKPWAELFLAVCVFNSWLFTYLRGKPLNFAFKLDADLWPSVGAWMPWNNAYVAYAGVLIGFASLSMVSSLEDRSLSASLSERVPRGTRVRFYVLLGLAAASLLQCVPAIANIVAFQRTDAEPGWWIIMNLSVFPLGVLVAVGACGCLRYIYLALQAAVDA